MPKYKCTSFIKFYVHDKSHITLLLIDCKCYIKGGGGGGGGGGGKYLLFVLGPQLSSVYFHNLN